MAQKTKERKNNHKVSSRPLLNLLVGLGFFTIIIIVTMITASKNSGTGYGINTGTALQDSQVAPTGVVPDDGSILACIKAIDTQSKKITLFDVNKKTTLTLNYTGGTNFADKYDKIMAASQLEAGTMVDAIYQPEKSKLTELAISGKAWEYVGVNNFTINTSDLTMKIASTLYKFGDDVLVRNGQEFVPISTITEQDELTVRGYEETIYSITITRGHGTVVLEDYDAFIGAYITIGYEAMQQITENMEIKVREGNFNLTVENGKYSATKNITVARDKVSYVSLSDLGPVATGQGRVDFEITPFGADLYIDGELTSYANPVELDYGDHTIEASLGGYTTYDGKLTIDSASKTMKIDLPEAASEEEATATETDSGAEGDSLSQSSGTDSSDDNTSGTSTASEEDIDKSHSIYVNKPIGASVYIDGKFKCIAPDSFDKIIGTHVITFIQDGYETMSYTIEVSDDKLDTYLTFPELVKK